MRSETGSSNLPMVYVLVVNWRGWKDTIECLESVFRLDYERLKVVVCNNDPGDPSLARIAEWAEGTVQATTSASPVPMPGAVSKPIPTVHLSRTSAETASPSAIPNDCPLILIETGENLGFAGGNNVGLRYVLRQGDADYVWLLNNDTVVDPMALGHLVRLAQDRPDAGVVGSKVLYYDRPEVIQLAGGGRVIRWTGWTTFPGQGDIERGQWDEIVEPEYIGGASFFVRTGVLDTVGLLDERYFLYSEEVDWCIRARQKGWALLYCPMSRIWHKGGESVGYGSPTHDYYALRSVLLLVKKFYPLRLPIAFLYTLYRFLAPRIVRMQPERFAAVLRAYRDFFRLALTDDPEVPNTIRKPR